MSKLPDDVRSEGKRIAAKLGETTPQPKFVLMLLVREYGSAWVEELADLAIAIHQAGGMKRLDGVDRTLGGIFFRLVKDKITLRTWIKIIPKPARSRPRSDPEYRPPFQEVRRRAS